MEDLYKIRVMYGLPILEKIIRASKMIKKNNTADPHNLKIQMLLAAEDSVTRKLTELQMCSTTKENYLEEFCIYIFIATSKKKLGMLECSEHNNKSLISHMTKTILRLLLRARGTIKMKLSEEHSLGSKRTMNVETLFHILRMPSERCIEKQTDLYLCFIDYEKAFDSAKHDILFDYLRRQASTTKTQDS